MRTDAPTCGLATPVAEIRERLATGDWSWAAVVDDGGVVLGRLRRTDLEKAAPDAAAEAVMEEGPSTYRPSVPCAELVERMQKGNFELAFITDPDGRWLGLLSRHAAESLLD